MFLYSPSFASILTDLVPVSSTVIPLTALEVSYGLGGKPSEEYKEAYLKKLRKKVHEHDKSASDKQADPDTLITSKYDDDDDGYGE